MDVDLSIPLTDLPRLSLGEWKDGETNLAEQVALLKEDFFGPLRKAMKYTSMTAMPKGGQIGHREARCKVMWIPSDALQIVAYNLRGSWNKIIIPGTLLILLNGSTTVVTQLLSQRSAMLQTWV